MRFKPRIMLLLLFVPLFFVSSSWAALEIDRGPIYGLLKKALPFKNLELAGYLKNETALRTAHGFDEFMKESNIAQLEAEYKFNDNIQLFTILRWFYDSVYDIEDKYSLLVESKSNQKLQQPEKQQWLRECYLDLLTDKLDMRLGKQQVVWGTADGVRILDIVNPLDYTEWTLKDYIDSRIPLWMINAEGKLLMNGQLQLLLIPDYQPNYYAPAGAPFTLRTVQLTALPPTRGTTVSTISQKPARNFENTKVGLRWRHIIEGHAFEYTLNYLNTYDFASSAYTDVAPVIMMIGGVPTVIGANVFTTRRAERIQVFGGTFSKTITEGVMLPGLGKGWTLRGELAYISGGAMNFGIDANAKGTVDVDQYNYVLGFDKSFFTNWQFSFQFIQMWALQKEKATGFLKPQYTLLNGATRGPLDKVETILTLMLATDFLHEKLKPQILILYGDDRDWRISPKVSYEISDQWLATAGLHFFEGKEQYLNGGQFDKNDQVFLELKYTF
ncbi:MAG: hypothetical protein NT066_00050 [Candidatus Omnitrophica bacterium]|nr:hypothetical protein [Candidatus Omnitrophota bacterium]